MEILLTLIAIAASYSISSIADDISSAVNRSNGMSTNQIIANINKILNEARKMSSEELSRFTNQINNMQLPLSASSSIKDFFTDQKRKLANEVKHKTNRLADVERTLNDIDTRAQTLANQTDGVRSRASAKQDYQDMLDDATKAKNDIENIIKGVDQNV